MYCSFVSQYHRKYNARPSVSSVFLVDLTYQQIMRLSLFYPMLYVFAGNHLRVCTPPYACM